jgi:hypothetical protein
VGMGNNASSDWRRMPHFGEYLSASASGAPEGFVSSALIGTSVLSLAMFLGLAEIFGPLRAAIATLVLGVPVVGIVVVETLRWLDRPRTAEQVRSRRARKLAKELHGLWHRRLLHRALTPAAGALLEGCAEHWSRIQRELQSALWSSAGLPEHWRSVRDRAMRASDAAMADVILLLEPTLVQPQTKPSLALLIGEFLDRFSEGGPPGADDLLPTPFEPAREIAERLKLLAAEVEAASKQILRADETGRSFASARSLESCLAELRSIRQAEDELMRQVKGGESP